MPGGGATDSAAALARDARHALQSIGNGAVANGSLGLSPSGRLNGELQLTVAMGNAVDLRLFVGDDDD